jgi:hypothetical protein
MADWVTPVVGLGGVIVGGLLGLLPYWLSRSDQYRIMTFEKRLQAYQEAYALVHEVHHNYNEVTLYKDPIDGEIMSEKLESLFTAVTKATNWYFSNLLYVDENTRNKFAFFLARYRTHVYHKTIKSQAELVKELKDEKATYESIFDVYAAIGKGVGIKHLPQVKGTAQN